MATRKRRTWKLDNQGQYTRQIGRKRTRSGKFGQHKFRLGPDLDEAQRREQKLQELWEQIESQHGPQDAEWTDESLEIAKQLAGGVKLVALPQRAGETTAQYAQRLHLTQRRYPGAGLVAEDGLDYELGAVELRMAHDLQVFSGQIQTRLLDDLRHEAAVAEGVLPPASAKLRVVASGVRLHEAMDAFIGWIRKDYYRPALGRINDGGLTMIRQVGTLKDRHQDMPLAALDHDSIEEMFRLWRQRPLRKGTDTQITRVSAENYIGLLKRFLKWLHRSPKFDWRKPADFEDIPTRVEAAPDERQGNLAQVKTFSIDELARLNEFATPMDRLLLLLAINCGFGLKEIASLTVSEVVLYKGHDKREREVLGCETTNADSFIKRVRRKSGVYGEWILFPQTVEAMQWALRCRRKLPNFEPNAPLLLNSRGERFDKPTNGANRNQQIPNKFAALVRRIQKKQESFPMLSFGKLRKTAGDLIRNISDGEVAGVFLCHGEAVKTDDLIDVYTNRPYGKVFAAIRKAEGQLGSFFEAAGATPFPK